MNIKKTLMKLLVIALIVALATASSSSSSSSRMPWILNSHTSTASSEPRARGPRFELKAEGSIGNPGIAIVSTRAIPDSVFVLTRGPSAHVVQVNQEDLTETARNEITTHCEFDSAAPVVAVHGTTLYAAKGAYSAYTPDDPAPADGNCGVGFVARFSLTGEEVDQEPLDASDHLPAHDEGASSIAVSEDGTRLYLLTRTSFVVFDLESGSSEPLSVVTPERAQDMERWVEMVLKPDGTGIAVKNTRLTTKGAHLVRVDFSTDAAIIEVDAPQTGARGIGALLIEGDDVVFHEAYLPCHFGIALQRHDTDSFAMKERIMYKEKEYTHESIKNFSFHIVEGSYAFMVMKPGEEQEEYPDKLNVVDVRNMEITYSHPVEEEIAHVAIALERASIYTLSESGNLARYYIRLPVFDEE